MPERPELVDVFKVSGGDCMAAVGPCQRLDCRHHLGAGLSDLKRGRADLSQPCVLQLADASGPMTLERVGNALGVTRERVRQIEGQGLKRFRQGMNRADWSDDDVRDALTRARGSA